jgi:hypothetical protein
MSWGGEGGTGSSVGGGRDLDLECEALREGLAEVLGRNPRLEVASAVAIMTRHRTVLPGPRFCLRSLRMLRGSRATSLWRRLPLHHRYGLAHAGNNGGGAVFATPMRSK